MKQCLREGEFRARLDGELPAAETQAVDQHLAECAECAAAYQSVAARASRVSAWMDSLSPDVPAPAVLPRRNVGRPAVWAVAAALAAALVLAAVLSRQPVKPPVQVAVKVPQAPVTVQPPVIAVTVPPPAAPPVRRVRARAARPTPVQYYMALDEEPIDTGLVMRVALPSGMQADVIVDGDGRARAIRPVSYTKEQQ